MPYKSISYVIMQYYQCLTNVWQMSPKCQSIVQPSVQMLQTTISHDTLGERIVYPLQRYAINGLRLIQARTCEATGPALLCPPAKRLKISFQKIA